MFIWVSLHACMSYVRVGLGIDGYLPYLPLYPHNCLKILLHRLVVQVGITLHASMAYNWSPVGVYGSIDLLILPLSPPKNYGNALMLGSFGDLQRYGSIHARIVSNWASSCKEYKYTTLPIQVTIAQQILENTNNDSMTLAFMVYGLLVLGPKPKDVQNPKYRLSYMTNYILHLPSLSGSIGLIQEKLYECVDRNITITSEKYPLWVSFKFLEATRETCKEIPQGCRKGGRGRWYLTAYWSMFKLVQQTTPENFPTLREDPYENGWKQVWCSELRLTTLENFPMLTEKSIWQWMKASLELHLYTYRWNIFHKSPLLHLHTK